MGKFAERWMGIAKRLVLFTLLYNIGEAAVSLWAGFSAKSIALVGFGFDSIIECLASGVLLWRLSVESPGAERLAHRFIGGTFLALALYVLFEAAWGLWQRVIPEKSWIGIILANISILVMPLIAWGKIRAARFLGSAALRAEAKETIACTYLSFTLLLGLSANAWWGWWWADAVAALLMIPWLIREGLEGLRAKGCC